MTKNTNSQIVCLIFRVVSHLYTYIDEQIELFELYNIYKWKYSCKVEVIDSFRDMLVAHLQIKTNLYDIDLDGPSLLDPDDSTEQQTCVNPLHLNKGTTSYAFDIRTELKDYVNNILSPEDRFVSSQQANIVCYTFM